MAEVAVINRASLSQQIRDTLLERIVSGSLKPGDRLIELKIADEMQTSQAPVREALRELEAIGLIETQRNRGARVRVIDEAELAEIYSVRAELEALAGEIVARDAPQTANSLEKILDRMRKAATRADEKKFAMLNSEFHSTIVEASKNSTLREMWESLSVRSRTRLNMSRTAADLQLLAESHQAIIDAIASGEPSQARDISWRHVRDNAPSGSAQ
ncbi:GntR family transcriptional regulator [Marivita hallyeonensis]|uniref:Transcriptional regulator, GntR family n=1 Tax=Marivita hallyeonensis TaxID=996342 RepID=A0A1M5N1S7_9RHOB|nr:GntR family transcriptional regulator [Marivita hallyeonensis]SHG82953.1 transcriptional regulator, GntR family [Marivita hallyeonensis]